MAGIVALSPARSERPPANGPYVGPVFKTSELDFDTGAARVELIDGRMMSFPMPRMPAAPTTIRRSRLDYEGRLLRLTLDDDNELDVEIGQVTTPSTEVPVVYLDQLHWVALAQARYAPSKLSKGVLEAATTVMELAQQRKILLPMSGAHFTEIAPTYGQRRRDFAITLLHLSRGWQMRNPIRIRGAEYRASMIGEEPAATNVFTLEPGVLFAAGPKPPEMNDLNGPADLIDMIERVVAVSAVYSTLLEGEAIDMSEGHAAAERWAAGFPPLAEYMREQKTPVEDARLNTYARFLSDQQPEIAAAAGEVKLSSDAFTAWLDGLSSGLPTMPYLGRLAETLFIRLRNADEKWRRNDLNDMNFLCAASGYADYVVAEAHASEYLRRAEKKVRPGATVVRRLSDLAETLGSHGVRPD